MGRSREALWKACSKEAAGRARVAGRLAFRKHLPGDLCGSSGRRVRSPEKDMAEQVTRRRFLGTSAVAAAALTAPARALARSEQAQSLTAIYRLQPGCGRRACVCRACVNHDKHALFPTRKAANGNRAHVGCNCVIRAGKIHANTYSALFGPRKNRTHYVVDTRWPWVRTLVRHDPPQF